MNITNRLFTYPVLSDEKNDYKESFFSVEFEHSMQSVDELKLSFTIAMNCRELEELILNGQAEYIIHLECSTTAYREVLHSVSKSIEHTISIGRLNGTFDVVAFIILKRNVTGFACEDWVDDFDGMTFNLHVGSILAYQNLQNLDITKDFEEFTNAGSIFTIYKKLVQDDRPAEVSLDSSKIRIGLGPKEYEIYSLYSTKSELQYIFHSMLILPVLVYLFEELRQESGEETYHNKEWFMALEKSYSKRGLSFMEEVNNDEKTSYQLAQEAMELPLNKAFQDIPTLFSPIEED